MPGYRQGFSQIQAPIQTQAQTQKQEQSQVQKATLAQRAELLETQIQDLQTIVDREIRENCTAAVDVNDRDMTQEEKNDIISDREWTRDANVPLDDNRDGMMEQIGDNFENFLSPGESETYDDEIVGEAEPTDDFYEREESSQYNYLNDGGDGEDHVFIVPDSAPKITLRQDLLEQWVTKGYPEDLIDYADLIAANLKNGYFFTQINTLVSCIVNAIDIILDLDVNEDNAEKFTDAARQEIQNQLQKNSGSYSSGEQEFLNFVLNNGGLMAGILARKNGKKAESIKNDTLQDNLSKALEYLQTLEPAGVAATSLQDCFLRQIQRTNRKNPDYYTPETLETLDIILKKENENTLKSIMTLKSADESPEERAISLLQVIVPFTKNELLSEENVGNVLLALKMLNPFPAKDFEEEDGRGVKYVSVEPEVKIVPGNGTRKKFIALPLKKVPFIYKSKSYMAILKDLNKAFEANKSLQKKVDQTDQLNEQSDKDAEARKFLQQKVDRIDMLNEQLAARGTAVVHVAQLIADKQEEYFLTGDPSKLVPLSESDLAKEYIVYRKQEDGKFVPEKGVDVSIISRVIGHSVSNNNSGTDTSKRKKQTDTRKYMETPFGIRSFEFFIVQKNTGNGASSKEDIIEMIRDIVDNPPPGIKRKKSDGSIPANSIMLELNRRLAKKGQEGISLKSVQNYCKELKN